MRACKYDSTERSYFFFFQFFTSQLCTTFYNLEGTFELLKCSASCPQSDREHWKEVWAIAMDVGTKPKMRLFLLLQLCFATLILGSVCYLCLLEASLLLS